jgi:hypothetical protein
MESNQLYIEDPKNEVEIVRKIVEQVTGVNIFEKNRKRFVVEARAIYSTLLRDVGYSFPFIAETLGKDHTTIIHYMKLSSNLKSTDSQMKRKLYRCKELFISQKQPVILSEAIDYEDELEKLRMKMELMNDELFELKNSDRVRLAKIIKLISENTPKGHELIVERKLIKLFDE